MLLERASVSIPRALERMGGLQAQYAPSMYVGLWSRMEGFERDALTRALERRSVVQGTLMRSTIHLVSAARLLAAGARRRAPAARLVAEGQPRRPRRARHERRRAPAAPAARRRHAAARRDRAADRQARRRPASATGCTSCAPRRRARGSAAARTSTRWPRTGSAPPEIDHDDAVDHAVRRYLGGFGPATLAEIANWAGVPSAGRGARARAPEAAPLRLRGRRRAGRPPARAAARPRDAGARPPARDLGRDPARPRPRARTSCPSASATACSTSACRSR